MLAHWKKSYDKPRQCIKKQRHYVASKGPSSQSYGFSSSHVWMWELDHKESWVPKNWCFQIEVLEKTFKCPLDCKVMKSVNPKGNKPWIFIGRIDAEAEAPIFWPPTYQWHPSPVLLPGKSHGRRSLAGYSPQGGKESGHDWATSLHLIKKTKPEVVLLIWDDKNMVMC